MHPKEMGARDLEKEENLKIPPNKKRVAG